MTTIYAYQHGSEPVAASGLMRAFGTRIIVRAILKNDSYTGPLHLVVFNSAEVEAFEIMSVGKGVASACAKMGEDTPKAGQHCDVRSVAGDRIGDKLTSRYWSVPVEDLVSVWDPIDIETPGFLEAVALVKARDDGAPTPSSKGAIELVPG